MLSGLSVLSSEPASVALDMVYIRVIVELPGSITDDGEAQKLKYTIATPPERFRMHDYRKHLPLSIEAAAVRIMRDTQWNC